MSFGYSIGDAVLITQLAWKTVQNARKACGEHDELTREVLGLHVVLRRLEQEVEKPGNPINNGNSGDTYKEELMVIVDGCKKVLNVLDQVLTKYNALSERERSGRKLSQKIRFGNGKMADLAEMRSKLTYYTSAMSLFLNTVSMGTMGKVERQMNDAGEDLRDIKLAVNGITAHLMSTSIRHEGSVLTAYADDDRAVWKEFRGELLEDGFSSSVIRKHKSLMKAYIAELDSRGLLDEEDPNDDAEKQYCEVDSVVEGAMDHDSATWNNSEASLRPEAKVESPVESKLPLDISTEPNAASHLQAEPGHNEESIYDSVSRVGSSTEPKAELRWTWLCNESNEENQHFPAEEIAAPETEHGSSTASTDGDHDGSNDAGNSPRWSVSYVEGGGSDIEEEVRSYMFHKSLNGRGGLLHVAAPSWWHIPAPHINHWEDHLERRKMRIRRGSVSSTICLDGHTETICVDWHAETNGLMRWDLTPPATSYDTDLSLHKSHERERDC